MAISKFAKKYHEKMFPDHVSAFLETDPEFMERFDNFAFDEVVNQVPTSPASMSPSMDWKTGLWNAHVR